MLADLIEGYGDAALTAAAATAIGAAIDFAVYRIALSSDAVRNRPVIAALVRAIHWIPSLVALFIGVQIGAHRAGAGAAVRDWIASGGQVVLIAVVTVKATVLCGRLVRAWTSREDTPVPSSSIFVNLARGAVLAIGTLVLLAALGVSITPLLTALGVGGLAVGLALQPTLENLFSGIQVLMSRQIGPGDFVRLETGEEGWVQDVTWRNTTIKMLSNDLAIVPNATIAKSLVTNFTTMDEQHAVIVEGGVAYGSDLERVERVTLEVARETLRETEGAVADFEPAVLFSAFGDSAIHFRVVLRAALYTERYRITHAFIKRLHARFAEEGIEIPFPQRTVHLSREPEA